MKQKTNFKILPDSDASFWRRLERCLGQLVKAFNQTCRYTLVSIKLERFIL
jgi:hypothetical protein